MKKLIYIVASPFSIQSFILPRIDWLKKEYEVVCICSPGPEHEEGILIPPYEKGKLYESMLRLHSERALCIQLGRSAREKIAGQFERKSVMRALRDFYAGIVYS